MSTKAVLALTLAALALVSLLAPAAAQAQAQTDAAPAQPKGVTARGLVSSSGGFSASTAVPIVMTGQIVEIVPGGQTGRERYLVPAYIYVLEGILTTDSEGGATGVGGVQYHAAGQSVPLAPPGTWHNFYNSGQAPVKYLLLFVGTPGATTQQKAPTD
jgi:quercetin dioxygenase-like cupin family protein